MWSKKRVEIYIMYMTDTNFFGIMNVIMIDSSGRCQILTNIVLFLTDVTIFLTTIVKCFRVIIISNTQTHCKARYTDCQTELPVGQKSVRRIGGVGHRKL